MSLLQLLSAGAAIASFQQYDIGMTLEEARAVPLVPGDYGPKTFVCAGDSEAPDYFSLTDAEAAIGVERCMPMQNIGRSNVRANIEIGGGIGATIEFHFFEGRLFLIETFYDEFNRTAIEGALRQRFGSPAARADGAVQNMYGADFEQNTILWEVGDDVVTLLSPALNLRRMAVFYRDAVTSEVVWTRLRETEAGQLSL